VDSSPISLAWCCDCASFTQNPIGHDCRDTRQRRSDLVGLGRRYDANQAAQRRYHQHVLAAKRERQLRRAS
jgi:hypothetical protein